MNETINAMNINESGMEPFGLIFMQCQGSHSVSIRSGTVFSKEVSWRISDLNCKCSLNLASYKNMAESE